MCVMRTAQALASSVCVYENREQCSMMLMYVESVSICAARAFEILYRHHRRVRDLYSRPCVVCVRVFPGKRLL